MNTYIGKHANLISIWMLEIEEAIAEMQIDETIAECMEIVREVMNKKVGAINADFSIGNLMRTYGSDRKHVLDDCGNYRCDWKHGGMRGCGDRKPVGVHG